MVVPAGAPLAAPGRVRRPAPASRLARVLSGLLLGALAAAALLVVVLGAAGPASAHPGLSGSTPRQGARLDALPRTLEVRLAAPVFDHGLAVAVTGPDGSGRGVAELRVQGRSVVQSLGPGPAGAYRIAHRVLGDDGHPATGALALP